MTAFTATIKVRCEEELRAAVERLAAKADRSTSAIARQALREYVARQARTATRRGRAA